MLLNFKLLYPFLAAIFDQVFNFQHFKIQNLNSKFIFQVKP